MSTHSQFTNPYSLLALGGIAGAALIWSLVTLHEPSALPHPTVKARPESDTEGSSVSTGLSAKAPTQPPLTAPRLDADIADHEEQISALAMTQALGPRTATTNVALDRIPATESAGFATRWGFTQAQQPQEAPSQAMPPARRVFIEPRQRPAGVAIPVMPVAPLVLELAPNVRTPAALAQPEEEMTAPQTVAVAEITEEFASRVEEAASSQAEEEIAKAWNAQQEDADSQFRNIFGEAALHLKQTAAAVEALGLPLQPGGEDVQ